MSVVESQLPKLEIRQAERPVSFGLKGLLRKAVMAVLSKFAVVKNLMEENRALQQSLEHVENQLGSLHDKYNEAAKETTKVQEQLAQIAKQQNERANEIEKAKHQIAGLREQIAYIRRNLLSDSSFAVLMAERKDYPSSSEWQIVYLERGTETSGVHSATVMRSIDEETQEFLNLLNQCKSSKKVLELDQSVMRKTYIIEAI